MLRLKDKKQQHALEILWDTWSQKSDPKATIIIESAVAWFNHHKEHLESFVRILQRQEMYSLRLLDWMTTNYARRFHIHAMYQGLPINVYEDYRRHLNVYTKKYFDPFARRDRLRLRYGDTSDIVTTPGQLNFMKWFFEKGIDVAIRDIKWNIEQDMKTHGINQPECATNTVVYTGPFRIIF